MTYEAQHNPQNPEDLTDIQEELATALFETGAVKFGDFKLKLHDKFPDVPLSPVYFDLRVLPLYPRAMWKVAEVYSEMGKKNAVFDVCLGIPDAGTPLATAFSLMTDTPQVVLRKETKSGHGIEGRFMTPYKKGNLVLLIDDLITRADSKLEAIEVIRQAGMEVRDVVVLLDREQGGREQLTERGIRLHAAFTMKQLLDFYTRIGKITNEQYQDIKTRMEKLNEFLSNA